MTSDAKTVDEYLASLPEDRRRSLSIVRQILLEHLPEGYEEGMLYGMIGYYVPHSIFPDGYHCYPTKPLMYVNLGSQKNHMALYLMCTYGDPVRKAQFVEDYIASGKKLDMGKACLRFKKAEDLALDVIAEVIKVPVETYLAGYLGVLAESKRRK